MPDKLRHLSVNHAVEVIFSVVQSESRIGNVALDLATFSTRLVVVAGGGASARAKGQLPQLIRNAHLFPLVPLSTCRLVGESSGVQPALAGLRRLLSKRRALKPSCVVFCVRCSLRCLT